MQYGGHGLAQVLKVIRIPWRIQRVHYSCLVYGAKAERIFSKSARPAIRSTVSPRHFSTCHSNTQTRTMSTPTADASKYRLPTNLKPRHYNITIKTDLDKLEFKGYATIDLDVLDDTSSIVFNASKLNIGNVVLYSESQKSEQTQTTVTDFDQKSERGTVRVSNTLAKGSKVQLRVWFNGKLTTDLMGYYFCSYEEDGKARHYALTQFEPTAARRAFPCWDEPLLKATFDITMISRADTVNLSNMPSVSEETLSGTNDAVLAKFFEDEGFAGWKVTKFQTTPPMSTYIVAFANGPFEHLETSYTSPLSGKKRPLRTYATKDLIGQTKFGLEVGARVLPEYEKVFQIEYPLPKLDTLVAHDFDAGAMENWGLITGRTTAYCVDEKRADVSAKKQIADTQSHEVAHMWFGNITTMSWWDNLWLNEGFATLMGEVIILNKVFPEWKAYPAFYTRHTEAALTLDAKPSSHPIQVAVPDANDINQIFDSLSYSKAAAVLRMLSVYVGEENFLRGVSIYLKKHLYANSVAEDLWMGIQEATGLNIPDLMHNWITKIGFPVLTVTETSDGIKIRQDRFLSTGKVEGEDNKTIWQVPLNILTVDTNGQSVINNEVILQEREATYKLDKSKAWKINAGATGVYRVLYSPERLRKLGEEATRTGSAFSLPDRLALVSDAVVLASSGLGSTSGALTLIDSLRAETEFLAWSGISTQLNRVSVVWWDQEPTKTNLNIFAGSLYVPLVKKLGYEYPAGEDMDTIQLRTHVISQAATWDVEDVIEKLRGWFAEYISTKSDAHIPPDLIRATFSIAGKYGGKKEWEALRDAYLTAPTPTVRLGAISGMVAVKDAALLQATMDFIMDGARSQDVLYFFAYMGAMKTAGRKTYEFLKKNYDALYKRFEGNFQITYFVEFATRLLNTEKDAQDFEAFFKNKDTSKLSMTIPQSLDGIRSRAAWLERSNDDVKGWLEQWVKANKTKA